MSIDSRAKRTSAANLPFMTLSPDPNSGVTLIDRIQSAGGYPLPAWTNPDSHTAASYWDNETNAYDGNTGTWANENDGTMQQPLEFEFNGLFQTDMWRVHAKQVNGGEQNPDILVEVWINGAWTQAWTGAITKNVWYDYPLGQTIKADRIRITSNSSQAQDALYVSGIQMLDLDSVFWAVAKPAIGGCLVANPLIKGGHIR
jgi:hypothetical protein